MNSQKALTKGKAIFIAIIICCLSVVLTACSQSSSTSSTSSNSNKTTTSASLDLSGQKLNDSDISTSTTYNSSADGEHALACDGQTAAYNNISVTKTGSSSGDEADFYGENAAVFSTNNANTTISDAIVTTDGAHANGVFSYNEGTTTTISHSIIRTSGNCSGGLMTTGGATMIANDVTAETTGNSSAAIRSDRGGGTVKVEGGYFTTAGTGSPVIYSTADISVANAYLQSTASEGVVVEGKNSVALDGCQLIASNTTKNSDKSDTYQAVMIYQSMSGDASTGKSSFTMNGGTLTNSNGDIFFVTNTSCDINLNNAAITNQDSNGLFLRASAAGWGSTGSNGGKINLNASNQTIDGNMVVDSSSTLNLALSDSSTFTGAINTDGQNGQVYVEVAEGSTWKLTADSYVSSLNCKAGCIDLNGHTLYVDGVAYSGSDSTGSAFDISSSSSGNQNGMGGEGGEPSEMGGNGQGQGSGNGNGGANNTATKPSSKPDAK